MKIECYEKLYKSKEIKKSRVLKDLREGKYSPFLYIITLAESKQNQLEFFAASMLHQEKYQKETLYVIGLAGSYIQAVELVRKITQDVLSETGTTDIRSYFSAKDWTKQQGV